MKYISPILYLEWRKWQLRYIFLNAFAFIIIMFGVTYLVYQQKWEVFAKVSNLAQFQIMKGNYRDALGFLERQVPAGAQYIELFKSNEKIFQSGTKDFFTWKIKFAMEGDYSLVVYFSFAQIFLFFLFTILFQSGVSFFFLQRARKSFMQKWEQESARQIAEAKRSMAEQWAHDLKSPLSILHHAKENRDEALLQAALSKLEAVATSLLNKQVPQERFDLNSLIKENVEFIRTKFPAIEFQAESFSHPVLAKRIELSRAFLNILKNAAEAAQGEVKISWRENNHFWQLEISDDGSGITNEVKEKILRLENISTKKNGHGLGLQQAITSLAELGWGWDIQNQNLGGCNQYIKIPKHALLIDDDEIIGKLWFLAAKKAKIQLQIARTWQEAEPLLLNLPITTPIFIDSDLGANQERGEILAKKIFELSKRMIVLTTAHNQERFPRIHFPWLAAVRDKSCPW